MGATHRTKTTNTQHRILIRWAARHHKKTRNEHSKHISDNYVMYVRNYVFVRFYALFLFLDVGVRILVVSDIVNQYYLTLFSKRNQKEITWHTFGTLPFSLRLHPSIFNIAISHIEATWLPTCQFTACIFVLVIEYSRLQRRESFLDEKEITIN